MQAVYELEMLKVEISKLKKENSILKENRGKLSALDMKSEIIKRRKDIEKIDKIIRTKKYNIRKLDHEIRTNENLKAELLKEINYFKNEIANFKNERTELMDI